MRHLLSLALFSAAALSFAGCTTAPDDGPGGSDVCTPEAVEVCECSDGISSERTCTDASDWGSCECTAPDVGPDTPPDSDTGDDVVFDTDDDVVQDVRVDTGEDVASDVVMDSAEDFGSDVWIDTDDDINFDVAPDFPDDVGSDVEVDVFDDVFEDVFEDVFDDATQDASDDASDAGSTEVLVHHVTPDYRMCPGPACGGYWVRAVNMPAMTCNDGSSSADGCYVVDIDWSGLGLAPASIARIEAAVGNILVEGDLRTNRYQGLDLGQLRATGVWIAEWGTPMGRETLETFVSVVDNGVRCVTVPCFSTDVTTLNIGSMETASEFDLSPTGASDAEMQLGIEAWSAGTLRATGTLEDDAQPGPAGLGRTFNANHFYVPFEAIP
jgi:hypothetical protein